jgi:hypothetical protein
MILQRANISIIRLLNVMHISVQQAIEQHGSAAEPTIMGELQQMLDKKVFEPIAEHVLTSNQLRSVIRIFMFLKLKYDSAGIFDKIKARLVAGGYQQDRTMYDDVSSPIAALTSVMMVAAIAAKEHRVSSRPSYMPVAHLETQISRIHILDI